MVVSPFSINPLARIIAENCDRSTEWRVEQSADPLELWLYVRYLPAVLPSQGWKIHITANVATALDSCAQALQILYHEQATFKVVSSLDLLRRLNTGEFGMSQIGKFITIYPRSDEEAVHLAQRLDAALQDGSGPAIPSDRPLYPGSVVFYRYGGSASASIQSPWGEMMPAMRDADGELMADRRELQYSAPSWIGDPFLQAGLTQELPPPERLIGGRYLIICVLHVSIRHTIYLGADMQAARSCVIKGSGFARQTRFTRRSTMNEFDQEAAMLRRLVGDCRFPEVYDVVEQNAQQFLIMEDIEGNTLESTIRHLSASGRYLPMAQVFQWGRELADILVTLHDQGIVYGDLKTSNVIIDVNDHLRLIDFDLAHDLGNDNAFRGHGTRGYMSPQQAGGEPMTALDDMYSLGALLYSLFTGVEPSTAPAPFALLDRPLRVFRQDVSPEAIALIERCLAQEPAARFTTMRDLHQALLDAEQAVSARNAGISSQVPTILPPDVSILGKRFHEAVAAEMLAHAPKDPEQLRMKYDSLAHLLGDTLCAEAHENASQPGHYWKSTHPILNGLQSVDVNAGDAGAVLALTALAAATRASQHRARLASGAAWLAATPIGKPYLPGLYVGQAGVGTALLYAGIVLGEERWIDAARARSEQVAAAAYSSPDMFNGAAGRLRFQLFLWHATGETRFLRMAQDCATHLLAQVQTADHGECFWMIPPGFGGLSDTAYLGYAHGASGIADALLDVFDATHDDRWLPTIRGAAQWLSRQALSVREDHEGVDWPRVPGGKPEGALWCHGATGIGQFFLHAAQADIFPGAQALALRAALTVASASLTLGPTLCHGLAGNIDFLLDVYQETHDQQWLTAAFRLACMLEAFALDRDDHLVFPSESPTVISPDYMVGYGGIIPCLLRLARPAELPSHLKCAAVQRWAMLEPCELISKGECYGLTVPRT